MAKKSLLEREKKRYILVQKYSQQRHNIKTALKTATSMEEKFLLQMKLQKYPRNSSLTRLHNRCSITGRPKSFFRDFQLSRNMLRKFALTGLLPGVIKSSW